jgi:hypothetical protein
MNHLEEDHVPTQWTFANHVGCEILEWIAGIIDFIDEWLSTTFKTIGLPSRS